jgi:hypothetical protein
MQTAAVWRCTHRQLKNITVGDFWLTAEISRFRFGRWFPCCLSTAKCRVEWLGKTGALRMTFSSGGPRVRIAVACLLRKVHFCQQFLEARV